MPTYEYECKTCGHSFEAFQAMSDEPLKKCPVCGKELRRLIFGGVGVIFKGTGFYVTDKVTGNVAGRFANKDKAQNGNEASNIDSSPADFSSGEAAANTSAASDKTSNPTVQST